MKKKELEIATTTYTVAYKKGYTQCQEDMADKKYTKKDMLKLWKYFHIRMHIGGTMVFNDYIKLNTKD